MLIIAITKKICVYVCNDDSVLFTFGGLESTVQPCWTVASALTERIRLCMCKCLYVFFFFLKGELCKAIVMMNGSYNSSLVVIIRRIRR